MRSASDRQLFILALVITAILLGVGLRPFNYRPRNNVSWNVALSSLDFTGPAAVYALGKFPPDLMDTDRGLTLEIGIKPARSYNRNLPQILTLSDEDGWELLMIGQWKDNLIIRNIEESRHGKLTLKEAGFGQVLITDRRSLITLVFTEKEVRLFIDGEPMGKSALPLPKVRHRAQYLLSLGSAPTAKATWHGQIYGAGLISRDLDDEEIGERAAAWKRSGIFPAVKDPHHVFLFSFDTGVRSYADNTAGKDWDLVIPGTLKPPRRDFLVLPWKEFDPTRSYMLDMVVNLLGFIPFGGIICLLLLDTPHSESKWDVLAGTVIIGSLLSLFIEVNQGFLFSRASSLVDLFMNTLGAGLGALVLLVILRAGKYKGSTLKESSQR